MCEPGLPQRCQEHASHSQQGGEQHDQGLSTSKCQLTKGSQSWCKSPQISTLHTQSRFPYHDNHWMHAHELTTHAGIHLHLHHITCNVLMEGRQWQTTKRAQSIRTTTIVVVKIFWKVHDFMFQGLTFYHLFGLYLTASRMLHCYTHKPNGQGTCKDFDAGADNYQPRPRLISVFDSNTVLVSYHTGLFVCVGTSSWNTSLRSLA